MTVIVPCPARATPVKPFVAVRREVAHLSNKERFGRFPAILWGKPTRCDPLQVIAPSSRLALLYATLEMWPRA
ncbi:MAG TPA: hypothetical protein VKB35_05820 [Ktedonobacteraceae bacterium]|nr:hypothetical protein [Ktedonobacteraceae bacterium]